MKNMAIAESLNTYETMLNVYNDIKSRAVSVFAWPDLREKLGISSSYFERSLYGHGSVAVCYDSIMGWIVGAYSVVQFKYVNGERKPTRIRLIGQGGYYDEGEFIICYDTQARIPLFPQLRERCRRYAEVQRTIDVNVHQQRTPRLTLVPEERLLSIKNVFAQADNYADNIVGVADEFDLQKYTQFLNAAPMVFPQLNEYRHDLYNEMLGLIGITSMQADTKDRHVVDEVRFANGGNFQSRFNRFTPREEFQTEMADRFNIELAFKFYDDMPATWKEVERDADNATGNTEIIGNNGSDSAPAEQ